MEGPVANQQTLNNADLRLLTSLANRNSENQAYKGSGPLPALLGR